MARDRLVVVTGPTGVGKSEIAVALAERFGGEIVGADSRQIYRRLDAGTAKPDAALRARVPHHLIDIRDPGETFDLAAYQALARSAFAEIWDRGRVPFLVGGTLQYVRAVVEGWQPPAVPPDPALRAELEGRIAREGLEPLYRELVAADPAAATIVAPTNARRIVRALEVIRATGRPFTAARRQAAPELPSLTIALTLDRGSLYARVDRRARAMFAAGLIAEVAGLLAEGYDPRGPGFTSIGYREAVACLRGELSTAAALDRLQFETHRYIRQQFAWLRRMPDVCWIDVGGGPDAAIDAAGRRIAEFLGPAG